MTQEDILRMAIEAKLYEDGKFFVLEYGELTHFAALVAAAERERIIAANAPEIERINAHIEGTRNRMISEGWRKCAQGQRTTQFCAVAEQARLEEREACAKLCEDSINLEPYPTLTKMAAAIRARGNK